MAGTITPNLTDISLCEADDWDGGVGALDIDSQIQGNGCLTITYTGAGLRAESTETITSANFVTLGYPIIYGWLTFARLAMLETYDNGGLRFKVRSAAGYESVWKVAGSNTASTAGWACYAIRTNQPPDYIGASGPADMTAIIQIGWQVNLAIKGIVKWDAFRYGTGLTMTGGTSGDPCTWDTIWTNEDDSLKKYGVVTKFEGGFFVQGKLNFGDTGSGNTYFKDTSQVILFKSVRVDAASVTTSSRARASNVATIVTAAVHRLAVGDGVRISGLGGTGYNGDWVVASIPTITSFTYVNPGSDEGTTGDTGGTVVGVGYYEINFQGGSGTTEIYLGTRIGTDPAFSGISGCIFKSAGAAKYKVKAVDASVTKFGLYGCSLLDADVISLPNLNSSDKQVLNCTIEASRVASPDICQVRNCNFIAADDAGTTIPAGNTHNLKDSKLINCPYGIRIATAGSYTLDNLKFIGTFTAHIDNVSGGAVTINRTNGTDCTTFTGDVTFTDQITLTVTVKDEAQQNINDASVRISKLTDNAVVYMNEVTILGVATETIISPGTVDIRVRVRKSTSGSTRYIPFETFGQIAAANFSLATTLYADGNIS